MSIYLPVLLMGLLALASYWLLRATPAPEAPMAERPVSSEPDYFMRRFSVKSFDAKGTLKTEVFGVEARHFPATDMVEIDNARIRHIGDQGLPTLATARLVTTNGDNTEFVMRGDAVIVREAGPGADGEPLPRLEFHGEFLHIFLEPDRIVSDRPVTLLRGNDRLVADTLDYTGEDQVAQFKGRVKVQLAPR
jgi:lipopolysaccharide export system protein LptC